MSLCGHLRNFSCACVGTRSAPLLELGCPCYSSAPSATKLYPRLKCKNSTMLRYVASTGSGVFESAARSSHSCAPLSLLPHPFQKILKHDCFVRLLRGCGHSTLLMPRTTTSMPLGVIATGSPSSPLSSRMLRAAMMQVENSSSEGRWLPNC